MKNTIKNFFFRNPSNYFFWIFLAFLVKGIFPFLVLFFGHRSDPHLLSFGFIGDAPSYTDPIESLLSNGHYDPDRRMPGYGIIYLFFRLFFSYTGAYNSIIIAQLIISSLSVYCIALLSRLVLKSNLAFYLTFYFYLVSTYSNYYDICLGSESLCSAFLIFGTWYFARYFDQTSITPEAGVKSYKYLFWSGLFLTWVTFLRPAFVVILFIYGLLLLVYSIKNKSNIIKPLFIYSLAFILADGAWVSRNYKVHHQFIPLARGNFYYPYVEDSYMSHCLEFVQSWGGAAQLPDGHSAISWFGGILFPGEPEIKEYDSIPDYIYTSKFNKDSLYKLRAEVKQFMAMQKPAVDSFYKSVNKDWFKAFAILYEPLKPVSPTAASLQNDIDNKFDTYKASIKSENPFVYYVKGPLILLRKLLFEGNGDYFKRGQIPGLGKLMVAFNHSYYLFLLFLGIAGIILLIWNGLRSNFMLLLLCIIPCFDMVVHPLIRAAYNRFFLPVWPFVIACAVYTIITLVNRFRKTKETEHSI